MLRALLLLMCLLPATAATDTAPYTISHAVWSTSSPRTLEPRATFTYDTATAITTVPESEANVLEFGSLPIPTDQDTVDTTLWYYTLTATLTPTAAPALTTVSFCTLFLPPSALSTSIKDALTVTTDGTGEPISIGYAITNKFLSHSSKPHPLCGTAIPVHALKSYFESPRIFKTKVAVALPTLAPVLPLTLQSRPPPGLVPLPRVKRTSPTGGPGTDDPVSLNGPDAGKTEAPAQGLLQKYWWVVIPLAVMSMSAPSEEPAKKGGGAPAVKA